jgi:epoxyqueuosine reductase
LRAETALSWSDAEWDTRLRASALRRIQPWMWRRNIEAAMKAGENSRRDHRSADP